MYRLFLLFLLLCSCEQALDGDVRKDQNHNDQKLKSTIKWSETPYGVTVITVDNCQYIYCETTNGVAITHKENCNNQLIH